MIAVWETSKGSREANTVNSGVVPTGRSCSFDWEPLQVKLLEKTLSCLGKP